jgi:hemerythrin-like metal-binding protein
MQHFKWTKAHAVYLPQVDAEHRNLFRMAEELHQAVRTGSEAARVQELVRPLLVAIEEHFAHEERLMRSVACPDYTWHKLQHDTARNRATQFIEGLDAGDSEAPGRFLEFLARWFKDHLSLTDRMMGSHVRNFERLHAAAAS